jgi:hypothetical protein
MDIWDVVIGLIQIAVGFGLLKLGRYCAEHIQPPLGRTVLSWSCYVLGFLFVFGAILTILWSIIGPMIMRFWVRA